MIHPDGPGPHDDGSAAWTLSLTRALAHHPEVERVELLTRQILGVGTAAVHALHQEQLAERCWIVRLPCGPHRFLRRDSLWPYLDQFVDHALRHFRAGGRVPDLVHGVWAGSGESAWRLHRLLQTPLVFTAHTWGRAERDRLLGRGLAPTTLERRHRLQRRTATESQLLDSADLVVAASPSEAECARQVHGTKRDTMLRSAIFAGTVWRSVQQVPWNFWDAK